MTPRQALVALIAGAIVTGTAVFLALPSAATADYSFPAPIDGYTMEYRCRQKASAAETEANARAAHSFFAPALMEASRLQSEAMARSMSPNRPSTEVIPDVDQINAAANALRAKVHQDLQARYGCRYRGSV